MVDLNADVGAILKGMLKKGGNSGAMPKSKLQGGEGSSNPMRQAIIIAALALIATASYVKFYYLPHKQELAAKLGRLEQTRKMKEELAALTTEQARLGKQLVDKRQDYQKLIAAFGDRARVEELYRAISKLAAARSLVVVNVRATDNKTEVIDGVVTQNMVNVELQGRFQDFVEFRTQLLQEKPLLSVKSETIELGALATPGMIGIRLVLLDYSIDKATFEEVLGHEN